jgi:hypothetical protein
MAWFPHAAVGHRLYRSEDLDLLSKYCLPKSTGSVRSGTAVQVVLPRTSPRWQSCEPLAWYAACLDPADRRGNRASIGQILEILEEPGVADAFANRWQPPRSGATALQEARRDYNALLASELFDRGRRLRNEAIAHLLVTDTPTPTVVYDAIYQLEDAAEQLMTRLCKVVGLGAPEFIEQRSPLTESARVFWDTYFRGMTSPSPPPSPPRCRLQRFLTGRVLRAASARSRGNTAEVLRLRARFGPLSPGRHQL